MNSEVRALLENQAKEIAELKGHIKTLLASNASMRSFLILMISEAKNLKKLSKEQLLDLMLKLEKQNQLHLSLSLQPAKPSKPPTGASN